MTLELWVAFLGFAVTLVISPGPGNAVLAATGGRFGVRRSVRFWVGFESANLVLCLMYGFGLGQVFKQYPQLNEIVRWAGTIYILYLAYGFFKSSSIGDLKDVKPLGYIAGFVSVSLNPKIHTMILAMFTQFLNPDDSLMLQVIQITGVFLIVCIVSHYIWLVGGQVLFKQIKTDRAIQIQGYLFGICLVLVAAYIALS